MDEKPSVPRRRRARDPRTGRDAVEARIRQQATWVDLQIQQAVARGEFENLPGFGKPIPDLGAEHDPNWWVKKLIERERITVLPPALLMRKEDAELDGVLDGLSSEAEVRREVAEFNDRVRRTLYRTTEGPPMITQQRDVDREVERWRERRSRDLMAGRREPVRGRRQEAPGVRRSWLSRWLRRATGRPSSP